VAVMVVGRRGAPVRVRPAVIGLVSEVGEHLRARATLLAGSTGLEEHWRRRSTMAGGGARWEGCPANEGGGRVGASRVLAEGSGSERTNAGH
jgi:hypothetical protein